jgi:hypothetical protein
MTSTTDSEVPSLAEGVVSRVGRWTELMLPTMAELRAHRPVLQPLLLGWVLSLLAASSTVPLVEVALAGDPTGVAPWVRGWMWATVALAPVFQSGRALLWTGAAWALLTLAARGASFRTLFSIFLHGEVLVAAHGALLALYLRWSVAPGAPGVSFLDPLSLAVIVPSSHGAWIGVAKHFSLVHILWVVFAGMAGRRVLDLERGRAWALALSLWFGSLAVATIRVLLAG